MRLLKICCIQDEAELAMAVAAGATHVGLVGAMPSGPGPIPDETVARLAKAAPAGVVPVLLTSRTDAQDIVDHVRSTGVSAVQIVSPVAPEIRLEVRAAVPGVRIVQVVHVGGDASEAEAVAAAEGSDYVLLDSGRPGAAVPELGGTGRTHDWAVSARIVARLDAPVFLAGGLAPENVGEAIRSVGPTGVDVCSGVRLRGCLDELLLDRFTAAVAAAG